ncbi:MAG: hypothetical protein A3G24_27600 [Betaproteobacteria bacterium RIFCSPLOWO2_12_FULL_62_13]|nr:MAG: hypothetical protein A3G24_27600 [Betaproteobacteria bacterium RIFCSPLOWO2_12_FULL_62_13]
MILAIGQFEAVDVTAVSESRQRRSGLLPVGQERRFVRAALREHVGSDGVRNARVIAGDHAAQRVEDALFATFHDIRGQVFGAQTGRRQAEHCKGVRRFVALHLILPLCDG